MPSGRQGHTLKSFHRFNRQCSHSLHTLNHFFFFFLSSFFLFSCHNVGTHWTGLTTLPHSSHAKARKMERALGARCVPSICASTRSYSVSVRSHAGNARRTRPVVGCVTMIAMLRHTGEMACALCIAVVRGCQRAIARVRDTDDLFTCAMR
jgi:hypothetical protein